MKRTSWVLNALNEMPERLVEQFTPTLRHAIDRHVRDFTKCVKDLLSFSDYVETLFTLPEVVHHCDRTAFREDEALRDVCEYLRSIESGQIRILDVGCGRGNVPEALLRGLDRKSIGRVDYVGVDVDEAFVRQLVRDYEEGVAVAQVDGEARDFTDFGGFGVYESDIFDGDQEYGAAFDLAICHNVVHEIAPLEVPSFLGKLNGLLKEGRKPGEISIVDMETLPETYPECRAFNWTGSEFRRVAESLGFSQVSTSRHWKSVPVFSAILSKTKIINIEASISVVRKVLLGRLNALLDEYNCLLLQKDKLRREVTERNKSAGLGELVADPEDLGALRRLIAVLAQIEFIVASLRKGMIDVEWQVDRTASGASNRSRYGICEVAGEQGGQVFISYALDDEAKARRLYDDLVGSGLNPWIDAVGVVVGENWRYAVRRALTDSALLLICLSNKSFRSPGILRSEIRDAITYWSELGRPERRMLAVRVEECPVPKELPSGRVVDLFSADGLRELRVVINAVQTGPVG